MEENAGMRLQERRRQELKQSLLKAASELFNKRSFDIVSVDDIAAAAGVAKGTFYLYFKTKAEVIRVVLEEALEELAAQISAGLQLSSETAPEAIRAITKSQVEFYDKHPALKDMLLQGRAFNGLNLPEEVTAEISGRYRDIVTIPLDRTIRKGMLQGCYREVDAATAARVLQSILAELADDDLTPDEKCDLIMAFFEKGIKLLR